MCRHERGLRQRRAGLIVGGSAYKLRTGGELHVLMRIHPIDDFLGLVYDLGADAVTGQKKNVMRHGLKMLS